MFTNSVIEQFEASVSHFEVGLAIGKRFTNQIHRAIESYEFFQKELLPYHRTAEGQARYRQFLEINRTHYPDYIAEIEGLAEGVGRPFEEMFLLNLRGEYRNYLDQPDESGCTDCAVLTDKAALIGHNEDGDPEFADNMYIVHAKIEGKFAFTALSYPGFLCGNAFGFNNHGICYSINNVHPVNDQPGVGRHFVARSLLDAVSLDDAVKRVTVPGQASGFNYNIGSGVERRVVCIEVAPDAHAVQEVEGCYFHANHYQDLADVDQVIGPSSRARVEKCAAILQDNPPVDTTGVLELLGNRTNKDYPIFRRATVSDPVVTLCTALFDLDSRYLRIYTDHPTQVPDEFIEFPMKIAGE